MREELEKRKIDRLNWRMRVQSRAVEDVEQDRGRVGQSLGELEIGLKRGYEPKNIDEKMRVFENTEMFIEKFERILQDREEELAW